MGIKSSGSLARSDTSMLPTVHDFVDGIISLEIKKKSIVVNTPWTAKINYNLSQ